MVIGEAIGTTEVAVLGAGSGGYTAAIRLAELGKKVTLVDRESVGGVCLHHGCIPTKAFIHAADTYHSTKNQEEIGVHIDNVSIDFRKTQEWKTKLVEGLDKGIRSLLAYHKIDLIKAKAFFEDSNKLILRPAEEGEKLEINALEFHQCIIACGSQERIIPGLEVDGTHMITSTHALELDSLPESLLIVGGGYIGIELAQMMAKLGVKITIVEALPGILTLLDDDMSRIVQKNLEELGTAIHLNAKVKSATVNGNVVESVITAEDGKEETITTEKMLVAVGRTPNTKDLQLENTKVKLNDHGFVQVDSSLKTTDDRIYAIGDVSGGVMLAHKASYEAKVAAEVICGKRDAVDALVPYAIFSDPEIAGVGLTEKQAKEKGTSFKSVKYPLSALGKARIMRSSKGFFKVLHDNGQILGVHIVGPRASDMIGEAVLAMEMGATVEDLSLIIHPHPTLCEGYGEMADKALGLPINGL